MATPVVDAEGFRVFAKQMRALSPKLGSALSAELRDIGNEVRDSVRSSGAPPHRTGKLRRSVKTSVRRGGVSLYSTLPQAGVWEWGGVIEPRGVPITIPKTEFVTGAAHRYSEHVEERMGEVLDGLATRYAEFT